MRYQHTKYAAISKFHSFSKFGGFLPIFGRAHISSPSILSPCPNTYHVPIHPKNICFNLLLYILFHGGQAGPSCSLQRPNYTLQTSTHATTYAPAITPITNIPVSTPFLAPFFTVVQRT